ncbi:MAG: DUF4386 domain-containing protein [Casimicrobiaceae bacterium]
MKHPLDRIARLAGLAYLVVVILGPFTLLYVPGQILVSDNASATVANLLAHQNLYRAGIAAGVCSQICFVTAILLLYRLLRDVGPVLAVAMAALILLQTPLGILRLTSEAATLALARGGEFLAVFDRPQRDALTLLMLKADMAGTLVSQVFWGLWLIPLGTLVWRSGFLPRWIGGWLIVNGIVYVVLSTIGLWWPEYASRAFAYATPAMFGEVVLTLWLLVKGLRPILNLAAPPAAAA